MRLLLVCGLALVACSSPRTDLAGGEACARTAECGAGLACVAGICSTDLTGIGGEVPIPPGGMDTGPGVDAGGDVPGVDVPGVDVPGTDTTGTDSGPADTGPADTGPRDTGPADTGPPDTGPPDTGPADTGPADTGPADTGMDSTMDVP